MRAPGRIMAAVVSFVLLAAVGGLSAARPAAAGVVDPVNISVTLSGNGMGYLRTDDGLINCVRSGGITSGTCKHTYNLTGPIPFGYVFASEVNSCYVNGGGCVTGGTGPSAIIGPGAPDQVIGVEFHLLNPVTIQVKKAGTGSGTVKSTPRGIDCGSDCKSDFPKDASFTVKATAKSGSKFVRWSSGPCSGQGSTCTFHASSALTITATFDKKVTATPVPVVTEPPATPAPTEPTATEGSTPLLPTPFPTTAEATAAATPAATRQPETVPAADDGTRSTLILVLGSLLVVIFAVGGLYAMRSRKKPAPPDPAA